MQFLRSYYIHAVVYLYFTVVAASHTALGQPVPTPPAYPAASGNYVRTWQAIAPVQNPTTLIGMTSANVHQTTTYLDGLGRSIQAVSWQASPLGNDMIVPVVYDSLGREQYQYLPFTSNPAQSGDVTNDGNFKRDPFQQQSDFSLAQYPGENYYYGHVKYESSPLSRPLNTYSVGNNWVGSSRGIGIQYLNNMSTDSVVEWNISDVRGSLPTTNTTTIYPAGELNKVITTDENDNQTVTYTDIENRVILKKTQNWNSPAAGPSGWLNTYYVYDDVGNLRFVIPPAAVQWLLANNWNFSGSGGSQVAMELCFRYEYDQRNRMTVKKVPGAGDQWQIYDVQDRMVMSQDSNMRNHHQWMYYQYDVLDRELATGLITDNTYYNNLSYNLSQAYSSNSYPNLSNYTNDSILTRTFYDNYNWVSAYGYLVSGTRNTAYDNQLLTASNTAWPYPQAVTQSLQTRGLVTGKNIFLLGTQTSLGSSYIYDDRARQIQRQMNSIAGKLDVTETQYAFNGQPLVDIVVTGTASEVVVTKNNYDAMNRLKSVYKNVDGASSFQLIDSLQYNERGQVRAKYLGNNLDSMVYAYNIRDWLTGINVNYLSSTSSAPLNYFAMELAYDKSASVTGTSYASPTYNGDIAGTIWKSAGDGVNRKYDFRYDDVNRLTGANFNQQSGTSWSKSNPDNPSTTMDFSVGNVTYDANGNIQTMNQQGFIFPSSAAIDQLKYTYQTASNKLQQVYDTANNDTSKLGDFHYNPATKTSTDYAYDGNGNLIKDNNKGITGISYNCLNLPSQITIAGKGTITYLYDASGKKWEETTVDNTVTPALSTTLGYMEPVIYVNGVKSINHEEGRARWVMHHFFGTTDSAYQWDYDFFERDHLGNTRVVLTQEKDTAQYMATMEAAFRATEQQLFYGIDSSSYPRASVMGYPDDLTVTSPNDSVARVNGNGPKQGPAIILKVMSGDNVKIGVQYYYNSLVNNNLPTIRPSDLLNTLASGLFALAGPSHEGLSALSNPGSSPLLGALNSYLTDQNPPATGKPQAYLNWMLLDNQFNYVQTYPQSGALQVANSGTQSNGNLWSLAMTGIPINKSGYLYIYVSNATPGWDVFFDNLSVTTYSGPLLEETHYYPFGLTMAGISDKALKAQYHENKYRFNKGTELQNKEFSDGSGLELYETSYRSYDPQIGRFWQIDPLGEINEDWSPYSFVNDNPISLSDPLGLDNDSTGPKPKPNPGVDVKPLPEVTVSAKKKDCKSCNAPSPASSAGPAPAGVPAIPITPPLAPAPPPGKVVPFIEVEPLGAAASTPFILTAIGVFLPLSAPGEGPNWHPYSLTNPYPGHGNSMDNWDTHLIYEIYYNPPAGASPTLKYGITDLVKRDDQRPEGQIARLMAIYGASVAWKVRLFAPNNSAARAAEQGFVDGHYLQYGYAPIEQYLPKPSQLKR